MNRVLLLFIFLVLFSQIFANSIDDAITLYTGGDYEKALEIFLTYEDNNNPDLLYNIGNSYFKLNQLGKSILYYKRALKNDPNHTLAKNNLEKTLEIIPDKIEKQKTPGTKVFFEKIYYLFSLNSIAIIILFMVSLSVLLLIIIILKEKKSIPIFFLFLLLFFISIFSLLGYIRYQELISENKAVLIKSEAIAYSGPSAEFVQVFTIHEGHIFTIEKNEGDWSQIKLLNGLSGWIKTNLLEYI